MRKILLTFLSFFIILPGFADEGMWLPMLIGKNMDSMEAMGCRLTAQDIYNVNHASLKDAVVMFGGGCTGSFISSKGLVITNYHCGYGSIAGLSTVANNYVDNGFWAKNPKEDLRVKSLQVRHLIKMVDITNEVKEANRHRNKRRRQRDLKKAIKNIRRNASEHGKYATKVKTLFGGNQYILIVFQIFNDVRLVAAPPKELGQFGGNTDNWTWPRHTCDFSIFRVYADSSNHPAGYSPTNIPYHSKKFLTISLGGIQPGDFTLIMGYPARTNRYETSYGINLALNVTNPSIIKIRKERLAILRKTMNKDEAARLKLTTEYAHISNYYKYFIGQSKQLKRLNVVMKKQQQEQSFSKWAQHHQRSLQNLMSNFAKCYAKYQPYNKPYVYYYEAFGASKLSRIAASAHVLYKALSEKHPNREKIKKGVAKLKDARNRYMENFVPVVDRKIFARMNRLYYLNVPKSQQPSIFQKVIFQLFQDTSLTKTFEDFTNYTYSHTFLLDKSRFTAFCNHPTLAKMKSDPAIVYAMNFVEHYHNDILPKVEAFRSEQKKLAKSYISGLMKMKKDKLFYPDANATMRITYGQVRGYNPEDAVHYGYHTTLKGLLAKYNVNKPDFDLPTDFLRLAQNKTFGPYANNAGQLTTCFITNNDITGGNSGSPVLNADGNLLGLAFDGNWEAMSGDIAFDKQYKRAIVVDIRFILWVIDYYGHDKNLIAEMQIDR